MAIYKLGATGFPVCPTCSACGRHPISATGLEQAVAAPSTSASSSIMYQFSAALSPRPPDTTIEASSNNTLPVAFSVAIIFISKSLSERVGKKGSTIAGVGFSFTPKALGANPTIFIGVVILFKLTALLEKALLLIVKSFSGSEMALGT